jgi:hypothetical protein
MSSAKKLRRRFRAFMRKPDLVMTAVGLLLAVGAILLGREQLRRMNPDLKFKMSGPPRFYLPFSVDGTPELSRFSDFEYITPTKIKFPISLANVGGRATTIKEYDASIRMIDPRGRDVLRLPNCQLRLGDMPAHPIVLEAGTEYASSIELGVIRYCQLLEGRYTFQWNVWFITTEGTMTFEKRFDAVLEMVRVRAEPKSIGPEPGPPETPPTPWLR